jgi:hypothetical protein
VAVPAEDLAGEEEVVGRVWVGGERLELEGDERGLMTRRMGAVYEVSTVLERGLLKSAHIVMFIELVSFIMKALILEYLKYHLVGIIAGVIKKRVEVMNTVSSDVSIECSSDCRITAHLWPCPCDSETYLFDLERC